MLTATDYYPFGMEMPGRKYNPQNYRYGFNGKENDRSGEWGLGLVQDYGFRLYNPGLGRFLSVDPLRESYPAWSSFAFAMNRPISGVDLDGLEYVTSIYRVTVAKGITKVTHQTVWYNHQHHNWYGPKGKGVEYRIIIDNNDSHTSREVNAFISKSGPLQYGAYTGSVGMPAFNINTGMLDNRYRYDLPAVDFVDQQSKLHDLGYDRVDAVGASGLLSDFATTIYDIQASEKWQWFVNNHKVGDSDPFNGQPITAEAISFANNAIWGFKKAINRKELKIMEYMKENHSDIYNDNAEKAANSIPFRQHIYEKDLKKLNFESFLKTYMIKDENGDYKKRPGYWDGNQPKAPKA